MQFGPAQHVGKRLRGGARTPEIGADDQLATYLRTSVHIQVLQGKSRLLDLPLAYGIQRNIHLALQTMRRIVGGTPMTDKENGTNVLWHENPSYRMVR